MHCDQFSDLSFDVSYSKDFVIKLTQKGVIQFLSNSKKITFHSALILLLQDSIPIRLLIWVYTLMWLILGSSRDHYNPKKDFQKMFLDAALIPLY